MGPARLRILGGIEKAVLRFVHAGQWERYGITARDALSKITVSALILKQDAPPETRKANEEAAKAEARKTGPHLTAPGTTSITSRGSARSTC